MKVVAIIAVRLKSTRLPEKALVDIEGLPMFVHTCKRAALAKAVDHVYLATDDDKIKNIAEFHGIDVIMTAASHMNSSERIAEACDSVEADIIVNIQGDEPMVYPEHVDQVIAPMLTDNAIEVAVGVTKFYKKNSLGDIKAVMDEKKKILYASRNDIPCSFKGSDSPMWKMCFIVPFRKVVVKKYLEWKPTPLELTEDNHFLRLIENNTSMYGVEIDGAKVSVDTQGDLEEIRRLMKDDHVKTKYM